MYATRLGTTSPSDIFNIMTENLNIVRQKSSPALQRRVLSSVMGEVTLYCREIVTDLMDVWRSNKESVDLEYICAVVNDAGTLLDHLELLESSFTAALQSESERRGAAKSDAAARSAGGDDADEEEEDLEAVKNDLPRSKSEILNGGCRLVGVLRDMLIADCLPQMNALFTAEWLSGDVSVRRLLALCFLSRSAMIGCGCVCVCVCVQLVAIMCSTCSDYFNDIKPMLDPFFFERLVSVVLTNISAWLPAVPVGA